jgi:hypothetical protein
MHEDGASYRANQVSVTVNGKTRNLDVRSDGSVQAGNSEEVEALLHDHGRFFRLNDEDSGSVLDEMTVDEVKDYLSTVDDVEVLKELREDEDRKTAQQAIDRRIAEVRDSDDSQE